MLFKEVELGEFDFKRNRFPIETNGILSDWNKYLLVENSSIRVSNSTGSIPIKSGRRKIYLKTQDVDRAEELKKNARFIWVTIAKLTNRKWKKRVTSRLEILMTKAMIKNMINRIIDFLECFNNSVIPYSE